MSMERNPADGVRDVSGLQKDAVIKLADGTLMEKVVRVRGSGEASVRFRPIDNSITLEDPQTSKEPTEDIGSATI